MPRLYIEEYTRALSGKTVCVVCREGILRDHFQDLVADLKFLNRQGIATKLYHNMPNRFANQKYFRELEKRLPETRIVRLLPEIDIYSHVLDEERRVPKLIFLERKALVDHDGQKINALTPKGIRQSFDNPGALIANVNFKGVLERICNQIDAGLYERVFVVPAGRNAIKYELFTIEGHGTLIANNFVESFQPVASEEEMHLINGILGIYKNEGYLKPRTEQYIHDHRHNFYVTLIDDIVVGCVEKKVIDPHTAEIAALAISTKFRNQRVGVFMVKAFIEEMRRQGYSRFLSLTNNPSLKRLYATLGFESGTRPEYRHRQEASPGVAMYCLEIPIIP